MTNKNKLVKLKKLFIFFIITSIFFISIFYYIFEQNKKSFLKQTTQKYTEIYNTVYEQHKEFADIFESGIVKKIKIKKHLYEYSNLSKSEIDTLRIKIVNDLNERKNIFKRKNLSNINVILPNKTIFLNYKHKEYTNKNICSKNKLIPLVIRDKKFHSSFSVGNCGSGYRFAYPLIENKKLVGVIEFVFDASTFTKSIMKQHLVLSNFFTFSSMFNKNFLEETKIYKPSHHKGMLFNTNVLKELKNVSQKNMKNLVPKKEIIKQLRKNFDKKVPSTLYDTNIDMLFTAIPVINKITNENEAVLTIRSMGTVFSQFNKDYYIIVILIIIVLFLICIVVYFNLIKEEQFQQLQEQSKMAQMGEMLESIAHQWRQPLSVITTTATGIQVQREFGDKSEELLNNSLDNIVDSANHLSDTINDFRSFYKKDITPSFFSLKEVIDKSISLLISQLKNRNIEIIKEIEDVQILGYKNEIIQVFMNLFKNAIDELEKLGDQKRLIILDMKKENNLIVLSVQDNAGGVSENIIDKVFDNHFTTKEDKDGTGIGLYMSKLMIEKSNGDIKVENREFVYNNTKYKGACFKIYLLMED